MSESFVDLAYRGLPLGRRIKLTLIRPSTGYLELPAPMPVGTKLSIATENGLSIEAIVTQIHEQIGGSERTPGMTVAPALGGEEAAAWWKARVALPELDPSSEPRARVVAAPRPAPSPAPAPPSPPPVVAESPPPPPVVEVRPAPAPPSSPAVAAEPAEPAALPSEDPAPLPPLEAAPLPPAPPAPVPPLEAVAAPEPAALEPAGLDQLASADLPLVDDGKKTIMMRSVDLSALGLEASSSGPLPVSPAESEIPTGEAGEGDDDDEVEIEIEAGSEASGPVAAAAPADAAAAPSTSPNGDPRQPVVPAGRKQPYGKKRNKKRR